MRWMMQTAIYDRVRDRLRQLLGIQRLPSSLPRCLVILLNRYAIDDSEVSFWFLGYLLLDDDRFTRLMESDSIQRRAIILEALEDYRSQSSESVNVRSHAAARLFLDRAAHLLNRRPRRPSEAVRWLNQRYRMDAPVGFWRMLLVERWDEVQSRQMEYRLSEWLRQALLEVSEDV